MYKIPRVVIPSKTLHVECPARTHVLTHLSGPYPSAVELHPFG